MSDHSSQAGFSAIELLVTLFVAAAFLLASYQLFTLVVRDGGATRSQAKAANLAYENLRRYASSATVPCTSSTPLNNASATVDGLVDVTVTVTVSCANSTTDSLSRIEATVNYNNPQETVSYATFLQP